MFDTIRKSIARRRSLEQIARLDRHLLEDIGYGHLAGRNRHEPLLLMPHGPFERRG